MSIFDVVAVGKKIDSIYSGFCLPVCKKYGINQSCFNAFLFVVNNPAHNTARDLCTIRGMKTGIASVCVETLIQMGLLERYTDADDRRVVRLIPTVAAEPLIAEARKATEDFKKAIMSGVEDREIDVIKGFIQKLAENARKLDKEMKLS